MMREIRVELIVTVDGDWGEDFTEVDPRDVADSLGQEAAWAVEGLAFDVDAHDESDGFEVENVALNGVELLPANR